MTISLEVWPTKAKEAPSPNEVRLALLDTNPLFHSLRDLSTQKSQKISLYGLLLGKFYILWAEKVQRSYLSWNWRRMQNLERIWQILMWRLESLKNFHFNGVLLSKLYIFWAKKVQGSYLSWNWRGLQNLERNWLVSKLA